MIRHVSGYNGGRVAVSKIEHAGYGIGRRVLLRLLPKEGEGLAIELDGDSAAELARWILQDAGRLLTDTGRAV